MRKKLFIASAPRCGLKWVTTILNVMGIDSQHNHWGRQAQATWKNLESEEECIVIHLLHNPFNAVPNIIKANLNLEDYEFRQQLLLNEFGININQYNELNNAALTFLLWNNMIEKKFPEAVEIQVEHCHDKLRGILNKFNFLTNSASLPPFNKIPPEQIEWDKLDPHLLQTLDLWCVKHKYPTIREQYKFYQQINKKSDPPKPNLYGPRRREVVAPHTSMTRPSKPANSDLADQVAIVPRIKHKVVVVSSGARAVSSREAAKRATFGIKQM